VAVLRKTTLPTTTTVLVAQVAVVVEQLQPWVTATTTQEHTAVVEAETLVAALVLADVPPTAVTEDQVLLFFPTQTLTQIFQELLGLGTLDQLILEVIRSTHLHQDQER
jgi:hypothetical protein